VSTVQLNGDVNPAMQSSHWSSSMSSVMSQVRMQVTPENVLRVRAALLAESDRLLSTLRSGGPPGDWVGLCGGDPLSADARGVFNERIDKAVGHCRGHAERLRSAAHSLDGIARDYGHTDTDIAGPYRSAR
jgi:hypothetical protein